MCCGTITTGTLQAVNKFCIILVCPSGCGAGTPGLCTHTHTHTSVCSANVNITSRIVHKCLHWCASIDLCKRAGARLVQHSLDTWQEVEPHRPACCCWHWVHRELVLAQAHNCNLLASNPDINCKKPVLDDCLHTNTPLLCTVAMAAAQSLLSHLVWGGSTFICTSLN